MPSFDIVSEFEMQELNNAVNQANREIGNRFDLRGTSCKVEHQEAVVTLIADEEFQVGQVREIFKNQLIKRGIDIRAMDEQAPQINLGSARQTVIIKQGIESLLAKKIVKQIKETKMKVQASIQGEKIRVTGKKRDDLQGIITFLKELVKDNKVELPLQYENFRD